MTACSWQKCKRTFAVNKTTEVMSEDYGRTSRIVVLAGFSGTIFRLALLWWSLSSTKNLAGCDLLRVPNGYTNEIYPTKKMQRLILTEIPSHFCHKAIASGQRRLDTILIDHMI